MQHKVLFNNNINDFKEAFLELDSLGKTLLILSCDQNNYDTEELSNLCKNASSVVIGGIFPQIIYATKNYEIGCIICSLDDVLETTLIKEISEQPNLSSFIEQNIEVDLDSTNTIFVFVDGLSKNIGNMIHGLFDNFGLFANYIGGGAGSLSFVQKPVIFTNEGLFQDCAIVGVSKLKSSIGVKHGWEPISESIKVTKSDKNIVIELDYKPAFEVYKSFVEADSCKIFNDDNFFDIAKGYPLGINKLIGDIIVRDPIITQNNSLVCVGDVQENGFVVILKGSNENLINSAKQAYLDAKSSSNFDSFTLFIDCISRVLFLNEEFEKELEQVNETDSITIGVLSLGEIANNKNHYLEFYNKTAVVAKIERY